MSRVSAASQLLALALLATVAAPALGQEGATLRVAADGSGDHLTIAAALEAAAPGDTILIAPGEYVENPHIDKPVTLRGDGPREAVVISPEVTELHYLDVPDDDKPVSTHVFIDAVDATLENLTLADIEEVQAGLMLTGGSPVLRAVVSADITGVNGEIDTTIEDSELGRIILMGPDAAMTVRDSVLDNAVVVGMGSAAVLEDNLILDLPVDVFDDSHLVARGNTFRPAEGGPAIWVNWTGGTAEIVGNHIDGAQTGVMVEHGAEARIEGNTIVDPGFGIHVVETGAVVRDNTITGAGEFGILVAGNGAVVEDNTVTGGRVGIGVSVPSGYPPGAPRWAESSRVTGNEVTGASHFGIHVIEASPVISGNTICAGRKPIELRHGASPQLGTNEICEVAE